MSSNYFDFDIFVGSNAVTKYDHNGVSFIEGRPKSPYSIKIKNRSNRQMLAIVSVDGLSITNGKTASAESGGIIIPGYGEHIVKGWMTSLNTSNEFVFSKISQSYVAKSGQDKSNIGVIGVMGFLEKIPDYHPVYRSHNTWGGPLFGSSAGDPKEGLGVATSSAGIGTGWGNQVQTGYSETSFDRDQSTQLIRVLYYDDMKGLQKRGVVVRRYDTTPNAFPGGFCKPPF